MRERHRELCRWTDGWCDWVFAPTWLRNVCICSRKTKIVKYILYINLKSFSFAVCFLLTHWLSSKRALQSVYLIGRPFFLLLLCFQCPFGNVYPMIMCHLKTRNSSNLCIAHANTRTLTHKYHSFGRAQFAHSMCMRKTFAPHSSISD